MANTYCQTLVDASATGDLAVAVPASDQYNLHRFFVTISGSAVLNIQGTASEDESGDPTGWQDLLDDDLTASSPASSLWPEVSGPWRHLQVKWTGNDGAVTVGLEQTGRVRSINTQPV